MKQFSKKEQSWINKFEKLLKSMPETLEILADYGITSIYNKGASEKTYAETGDNDNVGYLAEKAYTIVGSPIIPNSNSL